MAPGFGDQRQKAVISLLQDGAGNLAPAPLEAAPELFVQTPGLGRKSSDRPRGGDKTPRKGWGALGLGRLGAAESVQCGKCRRAG